MPEFSPPRFTHQDIQRACGHTYLQRGREYQRGGRVSSLHWETEGSRLLAAVRGSAGRSLGAPEGGLSETLLSPDLGGAFEIIRSVFEPSAEKPDLATRPTEEAGYLVSGALDLWIGERMFRLAAGDAFRFRGEPYRWRNPGPEPAVVIWVIAPPVY